LVPGIKERHLRRGILFLLISVSCLLVISSFPPIDIGVFAWFGLAPLLFVLRQRGMFKSACYGFLFGCLFSIGAFSWLISIPEINLLKFFIIIISGSLLYFFSFGLLYRLISRSIGSWIVIGAPALWVALEYVRSNLFFLSVPWNLLGHSQHLYLPVIQIADITGVYGISFLIVMINQLLSQIPDLFITKKAGSVRSTLRSVYGTKWAVQFVAVALVLSLTLSYGWYNLSIQNSTKHIRVALVQANLLARDNMPSVDQAMHLTLYDELTREAAHTKPDLIVWPASSLPAPISSMVVRYFIVKLPRETETYLLVGGAGHEKFRPKMKGYLPYSNSEFLISPSGYQEGQYNKIRLLPFNEYLPLRGVIKWPRWISTIREDFLSGKEYTLFNVSGIRFGTPICWENFFPDLFRHFVRNGAQFMVSVTNEGFFGYTAAPYQSLAINVFRAVENKVAIVRAATTGISCFINPVGKVIDRIKDSNGKDLFISGILVRDVPLSDKKTFYTFYGDIFAYAAIGITVLIIVISLFTKQNLHLPNKRNAV
jgi:apolipoprotein N-acyltransferase